MKKIAVLISGSGSNLEAIAEACRTNKINGKIVCVISNNPDAYGLKGLKNLIYSQSLLIIIHLLQEQNLKIRLKIP